MSKQSHLKTYWRSIEAREQMQQGVVPEQADEFPGQELVTLGRKVKNHKLGRRKFFGVVGATSAAGLATGCLRKPTEHILPFAKRPEDRIPGNAEYYATAYQVGGTVLGLLVESQDGRPIKVEGNPKQENSAGASDVWSQASVLSLYDPDRSVGPMRNDGGNLVDTDWTSAGQAIVGALAAAAQGEGIGLVMRDVMSPTMLATIREFQNKYPKTRLFVSDPTAGLGSRAAAEMLMGEGARLSYKVGRCSTIFAADGTSGCAAHSRPPRFPGRTRRARYTRAKQKDHATRVQGRGQRSAQPGNEQNHLGHVLQVLGRNDVLEPKPAAQGQHEGEHHREAGEDGACDKVRRGKSWCANQAAARPRSRRTTGSLVGYAYAMEFFIAWYSGNPYESYAFANRLFGDYWWAYWTMVSCNVLSPQVFWFKKARRSVVVLFIISIFVNIGMWFERFVITVTSLHHDFLPSSWDYYTPTIWDAATLLGSFGLFFTLFCLFVRYLPTIAIAEVKSVMPQADPHHGDDHE